MIKVNDYEIEFTKIPNGETNMHHGSFPDLATEYHVYVSFKYEDDSDLIKLLFVKEYLDSLPNERYYYLTIYSMPYGRMDRSEKGSPFTLKYVSKLINNMKFNEVNIIEPHSNVTPALVNNSYS
ncbi:MAG: ribose-phosphate pyrophosphokinase, partial [Planococcus donghaensis]